MSRNIWRSAPSGLALLIAAGLANTVPAFAADTTRTVAAGEVVSGDGASAPVVEASPAAGDTFTINNNGVIRSTDGGNRVQAIGGSGAGDVTINNNGLVRGQLVFGSATGDVTLHNNVGLGNGNGGDDDRGWIFGNASVLGSGDDSIINTGRIDIRSFSSFDFGDGNDLLSNGQSGAIDLGAAIVLNFGVGDNRIENAGNVTGSNTSVIFGAGDDFVVNSQSGSLALSDVSFGDGDNAFRNEGGSVGTGSLIFGAGDDLVLNTGGVFANGLIDSGAGDDVIENAGLLTLVTINTGTGADTITNVGIVESRGSFTFGDGDDRIDNAAAAAIATFSDATYDFGAGADRFDNFGTLIVSADDDAVTLTLTGLESLENTGLILLGGLRPSTFGGGTETDGGANDRLVAQGVAFNGTGASRIGLDAHLSNRVQPDCSAITAADCVDFTGGSTAGSTLLTIRDADFGAGTEGLTPRIALIVGSSAEEHFTLDPNSQFYTVRTSLGVGLQKRFVTYHLAYDAAAKTHYLYSTLADEALQGSTFAASAQEIWRSGSGGWFERQADLRATPGGLTSANGVWVRGGGSVAERKLDAAFTNGGATYNYDLGHKQSTAHALAGADVVSAANGDMAFVLGGMLGYARSSVEYEATPTEVIYSGYTGGLYASYVAGPLFVDAAVSANVLHMGADAPNLNLGLDVKLSQDITSVGGQVEAGWRVDVGQAMFFEPLAGASYVQTKLEDIDLPGGGGVFDFEDDYVSFRAGAGLRAGIDSQLMGMTASYSLTGRYWNEAQGQNGTTIVITNGAVSTPLVDDFGGAFGELAGSLNLYSDGGGVSGFINLGGRFADGYQAVDAAAGVRLRW